MVPGALVSYARLCGDTLTRSRARTIRSPSPRNLGRKDRFDQSITDFALHYADQNERDYQAFTDAIRSGRLAALEDV